MRVICNSFTVCIFGVLAACTTALAQKSPLPSAARHAAYHLYSAQTFDAHAKDHARILSRYVAVFQAVPKKVVEEQTAAIRNNVAAATKGFEALKAVSKNDPDLAKKVAELEGRLAQIEQSHAKVQGTCDEMLTVAAA